MNTNNIVTVKLTEDWGVDISFGLLFWLFVILSISLYVWQKRLSLFSNWRAVEVEIPFGGGKVKIVPNYEVSKIAQQAWTEIVTRKAGLKFDEDNDVIIEVYNSWYELFKEIRLLIKNIPVQNLRESEDAQKLVCILIKVLNNGLRPHLTQYQARFRRWYLSALELNKDASPQEIQKSYPNYQALISDLHNVNEQMLIFSEQLYKILYAK
jgi:hypothetical protein